MKKLITILLSICIAPCSDLIAMDGLSYVITDQIKLYVSGVAQGHNDWSFVARYLSNNIEKNDHPVVGKYLASNFPTSTFEHKCRSFVYPYSSDNNFSFIDLLKNFQEEYPALIPIYTVFKQQGLIDQTHTPHARNDSSLSTDDKAAIDTSVARIFPIEGNLENRGAHWNDLYYMLHRSTRKRQFEIATYLATTCIDWSWFGSDIFGQHHNRNPDYLWSVLDEPKLAIVKEVFIQKGIRRGQKISPLPIRFATNKYTLAGTAVVIVGALVTVYLKRKSQKKAAEDEKDLEAETIV